MNTALSKLAVLLILSSFALRSTAYDDGHQRQRTPRLRAADSFINQKGSARVVQPLQASPPVVADDTDNDIINFFNIDMSMPTTAPSLYPSFQPSASPSFEPSALPSHAPTKQPSSAPSLSLDPTTHTPAPTVSTQPSVVPSISQAPSPALLDPTASPSSTPSLKPTALQTAGPSTSPGLEPTVSPTAGPSKSPSLTPTHQPSASPTAGPTFIQGIVGPPPTPKPSSMPTSLPSAMPSDLPSAGPSGFPSTEPSLLPSSEPSLFPSSNPTSTPTVEGCTVSADVREAQLLAILDSVADPQLIRDITVPQGKATDWLLRIDARKLCPDAPKILQRWVLAVTYFSTGGNSWLQCSNNPLSFDDNCGTLAPFEGKTRFLSPFHECEWAGITCDVNSLDPEKRDCVIEIEFEQNNLAGFIPSEIGLLTDLERWGMERGVLQGTIPTEIENLSNLVFLDLDYNELTGSLTTHLLSLSNLEQLDLNNNFLTGSINGIGVFPNMIFLQLHDNRFTGTVPDSVGSFLLLEAFTLHETDISGTMPSSICDLRAGVLDSLISDCEGNNPDIECDCCTDCRED